MEANVNAAPYMGANVNAAPMMGANVPPQPSYTAGYGYCAPEPCRNDFFLIVVLFILLIIVGACYFPKC
jgi:uncharacterized protein (TIGR01732 family)